MKQHVCSHCPAGDPPKPHNLQYFNRRRASPSGLDGICRECRRKVQQASLDITRGRGAGAMMYPEFVRGSRWRVTHLGVEYVIKVSAIVSSPSGNQCVMGVADGKRRLMPVAVVRETGVRVDDAAAE